MKYRKKPIVVEAFLFTNDVDMVATKWFTQAVIDEKVTFDRGLIDDHIHIYGYTINRPGGGCLQSWVITSSGAQMANCIHASQMFFIRPAREQVRKG